jgi:hypothetical protein
VNPQTLRATPARSLTALTSLLLAVGLLAGCGAADDAPADDTSASSSVAADDDASGASDDSTDGADDAADDSELSYEGVAGKTALELLLAADPSATVQGEGDMAFVTGVGGVAANPDDEFWALYVNGEMAQVGAGSLVTETGDEITWKLEKFTS